MRSTQRIRSLAIPLVVVSSQLFASSTATRINESEMGAVVSEKEIALIVPVSNDSGAVVSGILYVDLLDPKDAVIAASRATGRLKPGRNSMNVHLTRLLVHRISGDDPVLWYRVRYRLASDEKQTTSGIVALGAIAPDMFDLRVAHAAKALPGQSYRLRLHAANPVTRKPVSGVEVCGKLEFDSADKPAVITHATNSAGDAVLVFHVPPTVNDGASIKVEARKGNQSRKEDFE